MTVFDFAALAEERVGLVEEQHGAAAVGGVEDAAKIFLRFSNVFAHHLAQVDAVEVEFQFLGENFAGHGLSGATGP